jgi:hypothetical protein
MQAKDVEYSWPDLSAVSRQYVVVDDQGRYGIAVSDKSETIAAHPVGSSPEMPAAADRGLPDYGIMMTRTVWHLQPDGTYSGIWFDYNGPAHIPPGLKRRLTIVTDLGYLMPDRWADIALAGSGEMGHRNYGATLGKIGGAPPVKGQNHNEMTVEQAEDYAREVGEKVTGRGIRKAAKNGHIPAARKIGRDWLIPYEGFNHYLDNRPSAGYPKGQPRKREV